MIQKIVMIYATSAYTYHWWKSSPPWAREISWTFLRSSMVAWRGPWLGRHSRLSFLHRPSTFLQIYLDPLPLMVTYFESCVGEFRNLIGNSLLEKYRTMSKFKFVDKAYWWAPRLGSIRHNWKNALLGCLCF